MSSRFGVLYPNILLLPTSRLSNDDNVVLRDSSTDAPLKSFPRLKPAISPSVELSLTIVYISLYALLFLIVYVQLWMIWYYRHKRFSYQTVFLYLCLLFSGLRVSLFSFYFNNCDLANDLPWPVYWILYGLPVCLQFTTLCLLVLFFAQVSYFKKINNNKQTQTNKREKEMFYLTTHSTHFIYGYMASDIW